MRIIVTGASGMLGEALKKHAVSYPDHEFVWINRDHVICDLTNAKRVKLLMEGYKPNCVIHCAAKVGGVKLNREFPEAMWYENVIMNSLMVHEAAKNGVQHFIGFGSSCSYEENLPELTEENLHAGLPFKNNLPYGMAKRMLEVHLAAAKEQYGMNYSCFIPVSMFGPNDNFSTKTGHVIAGLIHKAYVNGELRVWGDGSARRQVIFSEDVARLVLNFIDKPTERMLLGSPDEVSVKEMTETVAKYADFKGDIIYETDKPNGQLCRPLAKPVPGFEYTSFDKAIEMTCEWFKNNLENVRS